MQQTRSDVSSVLHASGITRSDVKMILRDFKSIVIDLGSSSR